MLGFAIILVSLTVLAYLRPFLGIVFLYGLLPTFLMRTQIAGIPTTVLELGTYLVGLTVLLNLLRKPELRASLWQKLKWLTSEQRWLIWVIGAFVAAMILATIITVDLRTSAGVLKGWVFDPILAAVLLLVVIQSREQIYTLILALSVMVSFLSAYGLLEFFFFPPTVYPDYQVRLDSAFTSANYHAMLAGPIIAAALTLLFIGGKGLSRFQKLGLGITSVINLTAFFLTYSYGGYLGLAAAIVFVIVGYYLFSIKNKKIALGALLAFLVFLSLAVSVVVQSPKFKRDFGKIEGVSALRGRVEIWQTSLTIIKNHPVVGLGLGNFSKGYTKYVHDTLSRPPLEPVVIRAHNVFLNFWVETGIIGLTTFLLILVAGFVLFYKSRGVSPGLSWGLAAGLVATLVHGLFDTPYFKNDLSYLFWFIMAGLIFLNYESKAVRLARYESTSA